ncbi:hypothetical protein C8F01DRAFT_1259177 [Mycena amicta]|nr:hypothetical protein C8F01DRAFT_1259177 [Mycena amicta]
MPVVQAEYARLRRRVETMGHGFDGDTHGAGKYYAVWAGRKIGIFADWFVLTFVGHRVMPLSWAILSNRYKRYRTWDAAVEAITQYLWDTGPKQAHVQPSATKPSLSSESSHSPSTPSKRSSTVKSPSTPAAHRATPTPTRRSPSTPAARCATPTPTHLPRSAPTEYFVVIGKRSTSFFVDEDDARESAFALKELDELSVFCSAESLSDAVAQLEVGARDAAKAAAETRSRRQRLYS